MKKKAVKLLSILLAAALLVGASVGGTLAWLSAKTQTVTNTFTIGNITISLTETGAEDTNADGKLDSKSFKLIPGTKYTKDPTVTVGANSESCYLFVKVNASANLSNYITYSLRLADDEWKELPDVSGVYYREVATSTLDQNFYVLTGIDEDGFRNGYVQIKEGVTKDMMGAANNLSLSFTAYAVQKDNLTLAQAWDQAKELD